MPSPQQDLLNRSIDFLEHKETPASGKIYDARNKALQLGWFTQPFTELNLRPSLSHWRRKQWHYFSFATPEVIMGLAIVHTGYLSNLFLYIFDFQTKNFQEFEHIGLGRPLSLAENSLTGTTLYQSRNLRAKITNHFSSGHYQVSFTAKKKARQSLSGEIKVHTQASPLVNCREVSPQRVVYTHQSSLYRPEGHIQWNDQLIQLNPQFHFSTMDFTAGLPLYLTTWNWAAAGGLSEEGIPLAFNLAADIGTGTNDVAVFWVGDKIFRFPQATFQYKEAVERPWKISAHSPQGKMQIDFVPAGCRRGNVNLGLLLSRFQQPFGHFSGTIETTEGQRYHFKNMVGVTEEHFAKW